MSYQLRYVAYARATGTTPEEAFQRDGHMAPYIDWVLQQWRDSGCEHTSTAGHEAFDAWLGERYGVQQGALM